MAIDYALLMIFRFRDELREGEDVETAIVETMTHAGRSVIVSGSTVAVGLLSLVILPLPFIRSMGIGGMLIPAVSVITAITLLPALLAVLGERINSVRVMPKRFVDDGHPEDGILGPLGEARPEAARPRRRRGTRDRRGARRDSACSSTRTSRSSRTSPGPAPRSRAARCSPTPVSAPGVMKPLDVLVENGGDPNAIAAR